MTTSLNPSDQIRLAMEALAAACSGRGARLFCSTTLRAALEGLFDSPAGFLVVLVPGDESVEPDAEVDELAVATVGISVVVAHRLPPTAKPSQALYGSVGAMPPFLDLVAEIRDAIRAMRMPSGSTSQIWRYAGRKRATLDGLDAPAYQLDFSLDATLPAVADGDASAEISMPSPTDADLEDPTQGELP